MLPFLQIKAIQIYKMLIIIFLIKLSKNTEAVNFAKNAKVISQTILLAIAV